MRPAHALTAALTVLAVGCREPAAPPPDAGTSPRPVPRDTPLGVLHGQVRVQGTVPPPLAVALPASVGRACGDAVDVSSVRVSPQGGLRDAVVWLDAPPSPNPTPGNAVLDQRRCAYLPRVLAMRAGDRLAVVNSDALLHNVRAGEGARTWFNIAMPFEGLRSIKTLPERPGTFAFACDVHPWMRAWVKTFDHPFFARTAEDGGYRIEGVPAGRYRVRTWHERFPERTEEVTLGEGREARQDWMWRAADLREG